MTPEQQTYGELFKLYRSLPLEEKQKVEEAILLIEQAMTDCGEYGKLALALIGAKLAIQ